MGFILLPIMGGCQGKILEGIRGVRGYGSGEGEQIGEDGGGVKRRRESCFSLARRVTER